MKGRACRSAIWAIFALLLVLARSADGQTILYPGTFDPFHKTHQQEVLGILKKFPKAKVVILPIETADYFDNQHNRSLFDHKERRALIESTFQGNARVQVSSKLRVIRGNVFANIERVAQSFAKDGAAKLLVGGDVLRTWQELPGFSRFHPKVNLLVSRDPKDAKERQLASRYKKSKSIRFLSLAKEGLRSREVRQILFSGDHSKFASVLPQKALATITSRRFGLPRLVKRHRGRLLTVGNHWARSQLLPAMEKAGFPGELTKLIASSPTILETLATKDLRRPAVTAVLAEQLIAKMGDGQRTKYGMNLSSRLYALTQDPAISKLAPGNHYVVTSLKNIDAGKRSKLGLAVKKYVSDKRGKLAGFTQHFVHEHLVTRTSGLKQRFLDLSVADSKAAKEALASRPSNQFITVYRGVNAEAAEKFAKRFNKEGFISKAGLSALQAGKSLELARQNANKQIQKAGVQSAVLEHVVGDWKKKSPLVATSLDRKIAESYAGKGGLVFEIRVAADRGVALNDRAYWQGTPWHKTGNPAHQLHEFAVFSHIAPSEIKRVHRVEHTPTEGARITGNLTRQVKTWKFGLQQKWKRSRKNRKHRRRQSGAKSRVRARR